MSVPVSSILSAAAAAAVASAMLSSALWAEPIKTARLALSANSSAWKPSAPQIFARQGRSAANIRSGSIASAISPLDLRKLTMSDFGDVEGLR
ncbi:MAG TPA: hypothetical protein VHC71_13135 [Hyphomicrobium sp.]|nr:hypothetical protein [Hyphomicrobium sp.]